MRRADNDVARVTLGSVKSCYGHTEGTAGLTGALLAMQTLGQQVGVPVRCMQLKHGSHNAATPCVLEAPVHRHGHGEVWY